ncbi:FYN-binding protein 1 isoform X1 [Anguilla anguilla]|uniref:FYN-binding protein 1 isoform X1 n=1 Tax=Anguilla anguilla TaxID=7936 RepID=UPI0015A81D31|nr:FYN-binding protein 1 isoform X1 [Anguilla anguilla]
MARFSPGMRLAEEMSKGRANLALRPVPQSAAPSSGSSGSPGSFLQARRGVLESKLSGGAASGTPNPASDVPKSGVNKSSPPGEGGEQGVPKTKALASRFENAGPDRGPPFSSQLPLKPKPLEPPEGCRPHLLVKKLSAELISLDTKQPAPKPHPSFAKLPSASDGSRRGEGEGDNDPAPTKPPFLHKQKGFPATGQSKGGAGGPAGVKVHPGAGVRFSGVRGAQTAFNKDGSEAGVTPLRSHNPLTPQPASAPRPLAAKNHALVKRLLPTTSEKEEASDPAAPKKKPLPGSFVLGSPPPKPGRPPSVSLGKFQKGIESVHDGPRIKQGRPLPLPASPHGNLVPPPVPPSPLCRSLSHQSSEARALPVVDQDYDDVGELDHPPPLPGEHPAQKMEKDTESDGEMYEDLEERWASAEATENTKNLSKEEKKRLEQEKKEQKEQKKKELEVRKRFKLSGPIQVIHRVKVRVDCKGGKNDLAMKRGELVEIVRVLDNPAGRWLGRTQDGSYGYVKAESVEVDYEHLKREKQGGPRPGTAKESLEVYDDVGVLDDFNSGLKCQAEEDPDIYDDVEDPNQRLRSSSPAIPPPPPALGTLPAADDIYDDVDSEGFPPPPIISKLPQMKSKCKTEERDPKKQKKFEKEEKEFRKKFKFDGEIQVLHQVTIVSTLTTRKWGSKDLPLKPGEKIDVIVEPSNDKLIGRNQEGKIGYVSVGNIIPEDADIYDDVGEGCTYDND